jgi:endonuclease/exonuclease/phosphatase family metal-dependent hydrolase
MRTRPLSRRHLRRPIRTLALAGGLSAAVTIALLPLQAVAASRTPAPVDRGPSAAVPVSAAVMPAPVSVPVASRDGVLGAGWERSGDRAWTAVGDGNGFHVLVADERAGFAWRTVATLGGPRENVDQWIGNVCVTGSGRRAVVVYAPRTFTNEGDLFDRGGLTAVVDLVTGEVTGLAVRTSLAYFNPSCGAGEQALLTQGGDEDLGRTRVLRLDAVTGSVGARVQVPGQLTSPVPVAGGGIVAADRGALVRVDADGSRRVLARAVGVPFKLAADADGGVVFMEQSGRDAVAVRRVSTSAAAKAAGRTGVSVATLARGSLASLDVVSGRGGRVFVTGAGTAAGTGVRAAVPSVSLLDVPAGTGVSMRGRLAVRSVRRTVSADPRVPVADPAAPQRVTIAATALATGKAATFSVLPTAARPTPSTGPASTSAAAASGARALAGDPNNPADFAERYCSVPRNDPRNQAMQPKPRQVEWAIDQAVRGVLTVSRPANWKNLGMPAYTPQGLFPPRPLQGGGFVPAQVMLGIAAQESNLWQAARFAVPGVTANPLIGNYYGVDIYNGTESDDWTIRWDKADCGYGVTQVTDGMRLAGKEKPGETALPFQSQRAVALDFAANIAAGVRILQDKWNQTRGAGMIINNGDVNKIENWFYAVWAYNSGFHPQSEAGANSGAWGVGWGNSPVNPRYPAHRKAFLDNNHYEDAARPQFWPYPEKVMGWAAWPVEVLEAPNTPVAGYRAAWWGGGDVQGPINRTNVKPPLPSFCDATNQCEWGAQHVPDAPEVIGEPAGPCAHKNSAGRIDLKCWYNRAYTWKPDCANTCGNELLRFDPGYAYQDDGTAYPPRCDLAGLPSNAQVIDDVPDGTPSIRPNCGRPWTNAGTFTLSYPQDSTGQYPGKIDTHQLGAGFGGHFWFTNTRTAAAEGGKLKVTGTWKFTTPQTGLGKIMVHLPDHGATTNLARYVVKTAYGDRVSVVRQPGNGNRWVSLGTFRFNGPPQVTLASVTPDGNGSQRIAFDAMAFVAVTQAKTLKLLHWNLAGATKNNGDYQVVGRLVREVLDNQPDVITVNEICSNQFDHLRGKLTEAGFRTESNYVAGQPFNPTCSNAGDFRYSIGNAVLVRGTAVKKQSYLFVDDNKLLEDGIPIPLVFERVIACITTRFPDTDEDAKVCSTHLAQEEDGEPNPLKDAEEQVREMARVFGPEAREKPFILGGDMNIPAPPANGALATLYPPAMNTTDWSTAGDFHEVDQERQCVQSVPCEIAQGGEFTQAGKGGRKLDYLFADRWHFVVPVGKVRVNRDVGECGEDPKPCSDHWLLHGEIQMPRR